MGAMELFGRTNIAVPPTWLSLQEPSEATEGWAKSLVDAALNSKTVIDISKRPALWGGFMRGTDSLLMAVGGGDCALAPDASTASHSVQAKLISLLSCIGRDHIDFFFLDYRSAWEEWQISGALEALETAKQDGIVRFIGLAHGGHELATLGMWQFHDAFEAIFLGAGAGYDTLAPMAKERRVGILTTGERHEDDSFLATVSSEAEIQAAMLAGVR